MGIGSSTKDSDGEGAAQYETDQVDLCPSAERQTRPATFVCGWCSHLVFAPTAAATTIVVSSDCTLVRLTFRVTLSFSEHEGRTGTIDKCSSSSESQPTAAQKTNSRDGDDDDEHFRSVHDDIVQPQEAKAF